jgi:hypothetical protein
MARMKDRRQLKTRSGRVLTPDVIDELAAEAERGYDLSKAKRVVGRPSLGEAGTSPRLSFRLAPDIYDAARRRADEDGISISELARAAVARYIAS